LCVGQARGKYVSAVTRMPCWKRRNGDIIRLTLTKIPNYLDASTVEANI
jgi:hypothetical protein